MKSRTAFAALFAFVLSLLTLLPAARAAESATSKGAPDFVPGVFNDGQQYSLSDFKGKVVVLFFYEKDCPKCRGSIPERNAVVQQFQGRPVKFFAIAAGDTPQQAASYVGSTHLAMTAFADTFSAMEKRYGTGKISLQNIWQFRVIGPDGSVVAHDMSPEVIESELRSAKWKYKDKDFAKDAKLAAAVEAFEWNQHGVGMRLLKPHLKSTNKQTAENAKALLAAVKEEAQSWKDQADKLAADGKSAEAFDLYDRVASVFAGDDLAKSVAEPLKKLKTDKSVKDEMEARRLYDQYIDGIARTKPEGIADVVAFGQGIVRKYPNTPTARKVEEFLKDLSAPL